MPDAVIAIPREFKKAAITGLELARMENSVWKQIA
tara:strand:+ start:232 stop:336 length:105 start_codon:yes stop_codon:yes gene_type:complete